MKTIFCLVILLCVFSALSAATWYVVLTDTYLG